jgi:hypothetical protein
MVCKGVEWMKGSTKLIRFDFLEPRNGVDRQGTGV